MSINPRNHRMMRYQLAQIEAPPSLLECMQRFIEIRRTEVESLKELESIIRRDQSLASKVLNAANSTFYDHCSEVKTTPVAIVLIESGRVRSIFIFPLPLSILSNEPSISRSRREFQLKRAFASLMIAAEMTRRRPWLNTEEAAALGPAYDIGWVAPAIHFIKRRKLDNGDRPEIESASHRGILWVYAYETWLTFCGSSGLSQSIPKGYTVSAFSRKQQAFQDGGCADFSRHYSRQFQGVSEDGHEQSSAFRLRGALCLLRRNGGSTGTTWTTYSQQWAS